MANKFERLVLDEYKGFVVARRKYVDTVRMHRFERDIEKLFEPTIATITLANIMHSPECYCEETFWFYSCKWHWSTYMFIKRELDKVIENG
ncbi:MAG: hypothetical protein GXO43_09845 [Crenarchaeota archaeon]|nr:hypothetical protein [Thermoproteota archaeon]